MYAQKTNWFCEVSRVHHYPPPLSSLWLLQTGYMYTWSSTHCLVTVPGRKLVRSCKPRSRPPLGGCYTQSYSFLTLATKYNYVERGDAVPKTILHKPTANSGINIFYNKCTVYTNIIYNFYNKVYSVKQTVFKKQELFFEKLHFLQNLDCNS
jgi:hypothetical protein